MSSAVLTVFYDPPLPVVEVRRHESDARGNVFTLLKSVAWAGILVPAGFESDGASVPRSLWGLVFPAEDLHAMLGALVHDYVYRTHPDGWTKKRADAEFYSLLRKGGVPFVRAKLAHLGVRMFGSSAWLAGGAI